MTDYTETDYKEAHKFCKNHGDKLKSDKTCGCFYCLSIFSPSEIKDWIIDKKPIAISVADGRKVDMTTSVFSPSEIKDWIDHKKTLGIPMTDGNKADVTMQWEYDDNPTALCPFCGVDSVIGESSGYPITKEFLEKMKECWFR